MVPLGDVNRILPFSLSALPSGLPHPSKGISPIGRNSLPCFIIFPSFSFLDYRISPVEVEQHTSKSSCPVLPSLADFPLFRLRRCLNTKETGVCCYNLTVFSSSSRELPLRCPAGVVKRSKMTARRFFFAA